MSRIGIMQSNPCYSFNICHLFDEFGNMLFPIDVYTIVCQFLGDNLELLDSAFHQCPYLIQYVFHRTTPMSASNDRNGTIGTMAVTTLTNFDIGVMAGGSKVAGRRIIGIIRNIF